MSSLRSTMGLPVVTTASADQIGTVGLVIVEDRQVEAVAVGDSVVDWSDINAVGHDAVVVEDRDVLREPQTDHERRVLDEKLTILGKMVLDDGGDELGIVADLEFDPDDGTVSGLKVLDNDIDGDRLCGIGRYAVVVASDRS
jgi:sporulation protein YlmC with PRC-barrel domain